MKKKIFFTLCCLNLLLLPLLISAESVVNKEERLRILMVIGNNQAGGNREKLEYAVSDAKNMAEIFQKLGGVLPENTLLLLDPDKSKMLSGMENIKKLIATLKMQAKRLEMIFYYSGHSDEHGLLLGKEKFYYKELHDFFKKMRVEVKIAILDSCSSGVFTRIKGGKKRPAFLVDTAYDMKGYAFMSSSSSDEASQESDRLRASFFTHNLSSGLRGAADMNQDNRITLNEAYQYAYAETLAKTEKTMSGPQHPNYNIQMSGTGDVVMTDIRKGSAKLTLDKHIKGKVFIRDTKDNLVVELNNSNKPNLSLALEAGEYKIINQREANIYETKVNLLPRQQLKLLPAAFKIVSEEVTRARGSAKKNYRVVPWHFPLWPYSLSGEKIIHKYSIHLLGNYSTCLSGFSIGPGPSIVAEDVVGWQNGVLGNFVGSNLVGVQSLGLFNYVGKEMLGLQSSLLGNFAWGKLRGVQGAFLLNVARENSAGIQFSFLSNIAGRDFEGIQLGFINTAKDFSGLQLGLINVARKQKGIPLGLINISENGKVSMMACWSSLLGPSMEIKMRSNYSFSIISLLEYMYKFHYGIHIPYSIKWYNEIDVGIVCVYSDVVRNGYNFHQGSKLYQARLIQGYNLSKYLSLMLGVNYITNSIKPTTHSNNVINDFGISGGLSLGW